MKITKFFFFLSAMAATTRYMLLSSPQKGMVYYVRMNNVEEESMGKSVAEVSLFACGKPQGIAVDQSRGILYVADAETNSIIGTELSVMPDGALISGPKVVIRSSANALWVSVDSEGNLFYSRTQTKELMMMSAASARSVLAGGIAPTQPVELYAANGTPPVLKVRTPHGIFVDDANLYWVNGAVGEGVLLRGLEKPSAENKQLDIKVIQKDGEGGFGVCGSQDNIYYTSKEHVFGVPKKGGKVTVLSTILLQPRGCSWDGSGGLWVADKDGQIFRFPSDILVTEAPREILLHVGSAYDLTLFVASGTAMHGFLVAILVVVWIHI